MKFQNKTTFFHVWEEKLWGDRVDANDYFSTLTVWITTIATALAVCFKFFSSFEFNFELLEQGAGAGLCLALACWVFNCAESIIACKDVSIILKRSLLILLALLCGVVIGTLLSLVVIAIVCIIMFVLLCYFIIGFLNGTLNTPQIRSSEKYDDPDIVDTNEGKVKKDWESMDGLEMIDTHCRHYSRKNSWETWKRDDI